LCLWSWEKPWNPGEDGADHLVGSKKNSKVESRSRESIGSRGHIKSRRRPSSKKPAQLPREGKDVSANQTLLLPQSWEVQTKTFDPRLLMQLVTVHILASKSVQSNDFSGLPMQNSCLASQACGGLLPLYQHGDKENELFSLRSVVGGS
jgi:hypothetical protein